MTREQTIVIFCKQKYEPYDDIFATTFVLSDSVNRYTRLVETCALTSSNRSIEEVPLYSLQACATRRSATSCVGKGVIVAQTPHVRIGGVEAV